MQMRQLKSVGRNVGGILALLALLGILSGCANNMFGGAGAGAPKGSDGLDAMATMVDGYGDIELPLEMSLSSDKSIAMQTNSFQGGIHSYSGRVQIGSLKDYIVSSMRNNKWKLVGEASYKNIMLAFLKPNKTCMVVLSEGIGGTYGKTEAVFYVTIDLDAVNQNKGFAAPTQQ
ncbi:hypothetical protein FCL47_05890 [Desulfopila sp. IMCC35006]|uniref:hypothetical protein n=1 Tax=Desulfopila sp. IMCC35006 TaxID=2569542 RepID=UPI0010ACFAED|nr:hypothetical protein [Desulfopila sp. IMCC35006]TKB27660.1 hypothetical protein FCL47_05890 [Desulfopila sp. IMCC35006]